MKKMFVTMLVMVMLFCVNVNANEMCTLENPDIMKFAEHYAGFHLDLMSRDEPMFLSDNILFGGKINYNEDDARVGYSGKKVADGAIYSEYGTFMIGCGAGIEDEDLWYVSFTYEKNADPDVMLYNTYFMMGSSEDFFNALMESGYDEEEQDELMMEILQELLTTKEPIAIETGDVVFVSKELGSGQRLIVLDSKEMYEEFYKGSIDNYMEVI